MPVALALGGVFDHDGAVGDALLYFGTLVGIQAQVGRAVGAVHGINMAQANLALVHIAVDDAPFCRLVWPQGQPHAVPRATFAEDGGFALIVANGKDGGAGVGLCADIDFFAVVVGGQIAGRCRTVGQAAAIGGNMGGGSGG